MAIITANRSTDLRTIDLYDMVSSATSVQFFDNANFSSPQGYHYQDVVRIAYTDLLPTYALWGGTGVTVNNNGDVTGGTVTGFISQVLSGSSYVQAYAVEGFSYSAVGVYNASITPSTADDQAAFESVLSGSDTFNLSPESDAANGFAGNDTMHGNGGGDLLYGGIGNDLLDGGSGNDLLYGGSGNDTYVIDASGDSVVEYAGDGVDTLRSSVSRTLGANQENLVLTGSAALRGTGNTQANVITGNAGANVLNGGGGVDQLRGGAGNDVYVIGNAGVIVTESAGGGVDTLRSSVGRTLGDYQENLVLTGDDPVNGVGNALANALTGNAAANLLAGLAGADRLAGGAGNDTLTGGAGNDRLTGGAGLDTFRFVAALSATANVDQVTDFNSFDDRFQLDDAVFAGIGHTGALAAGGFRLGTEARDANDRIVYDKLTGALYFDADGSGAGAAVHFATLSAGTTVTAADFTII